VDKELRGLRFRFSAGAEIAPESSPADIVPARVTQLSLRGCYLETPAPFEMHCHVLLKMHNSGEYFEAHATVLYVQPSGVGLVFREIKPDFRAVLQKWVLSALDSQTDAQPTPG
jgi:PilZ domain